MCRYIEILYLISSLTSAIASSLEWDSPLCLTCNTSLENVTLENRDMPSIQANNETKAVTFRAASVSSSSSTESDTSEDDGISVTFAATRQTSAATTAITARSTSPSTTRSKKITTKDQEENLTARTNRHKKKHHVKKSKIKQHENYLRISGTKSNKKLDIDQEHNNHENDKVKRNHKTKTGVSLTIKTFNNQLAEWHQQLKNKTRQDYSSNVTQTQNLEINKSNVDHAFHGFKNQVHNKHKRNRKHREDISSIQKSNNKTSRHKDLISSHKSDITLQDQPDNVGIEIRSKHKHTRDKPKEPVMDTINIAEIVRQNKHKYKKHKNEETEIGLNIEDIKPFDKEINNNTGEKLADNTNKLDKQEQKTEKEFEDKTHTGIYGTRSKHDKENIKPEEIHIETRGRYKHKKHHSHEEFREKNDSVEDKTHPRKHKKSKTKTTEYVKENNENLDNNTHNSHELNNVSLQSTQTTPPTTKYYDIPFSPHKIKEDVPINAFTKQILLRTLRLFENVRKNSSEYEWKKKVKHLAENYEHKFKEFLRTSAQQNIKTKLGSKKVVLNAIEMSKQIANRLLNMMIDNIDKKGLLRTSRTQDVFHSELRKEVDSEIHHACSKLGICSTYNGFIQIVVDVISTMLSLNDERFKEAFDSLTDAVESTDFSHTLGKATDARLKKRAMAMDRENVKTQRAMVNIMKNVLMNRNKPLVMYSDSDPRRSNINGTLAFLEVIDVLDKAVPIDEANINEWTQIRESMMMWSNGISIQSTIKQFVHHIKSVIDDLNNENYKVVLKNIKNML